VSDRRFHGVKALLLLGAAASLAGCGLAYPLGAILAAGGSSKSHNAPPTVTVSPVARQKGAVRIQYVLQDVESDLVNVTVEFSTPATGFAAAHEMANAASEGTSGLASSPTGTAHAFVWDSATDLGGTHAVEGVVVRITPTDKGGTGPAGSTAAFIVGNDAPVLALDAVTGTQAGLVVVKGSISDSTSDTASLTITFSAKLSTGAVVANTATIAIGATQQLATQPAAQGGLPVSFAWNTIADLLDDNAAVTLSVTPNDAFDSGTTQTLSFNVQNNDAPIVFLQQPARQSGDVTVDYDLVDAGSDGVSLALSATATRVVGGAVQSPSPLNVTPTPVSLASSPGGTPGSFVWHAGTQLGSTGAFNVTLTAVASDSGGLHNVAVTTFLVGDDPPSVTVQAPTAGTTTAGIVTIAFTLADSTSDPTDVAITWSSPSLSVVNQPITVAVGNTVGLRTRPGGDVHSVAWNTIKDVGTVVASDVTLSITPSDNATGAQVTGGTVGVAAFTVANNTAPVTLVTGPSDGTVVDLRSGGTIPIEFFVFDTQSDPTTVTIQVNGLGNGANHLPAAGSLSIGGNVNVLPGTLPGVTSSPSGVSHLALYDPTKDGVTAAGGDHAAVSFAVKADDGKSTGAQFSTGNPSFLVNINKEPVLVGVGALDGNGNVVGRVEGTATIKVNASDPEGDAFNVTVDVSMDNGVTFPLTLANPVTLTAQGTFTYATGGFATGGPVPFVLRLTPRDQLGLPAVLGTGQPGFVSFTVNNDVSQNTTRPVVTPAVVAGVQSGKVPIPYTIADYFSYPCNVQVTYTVPGGAPQPASLAAGAPEGLANLATSASGTSHVFLWDTRKDLSTQVFDTTQTAVVLTFVATNTASRASTAAPTAVEVDDGLVADLVIGQPAFTIGAVDNRAINFNEGTANFSGGVLTITDDNNHRVLVYTTTPTTFQGANFVLGQPKFDRGDFHDGSIDGQDSAFDDVHGMLFVLSFSQLLVWTQPITSNGQAPDRNYSLATTTFGSIALDATGIWVSSNSTHDVKHYALDRTTTLPASGPLTPDANAVTGFSGFFGCTVNPSGTQLAVADVGHVRLYDIPLASNSPAATTTIAAAGNFMKPHMPTDDSLYAPAGGGGILHVTGIPGAIATETVAIPNGLSFPYASGDTTHLVVSDGGHNRVLVWSALPTSATPFDDADVAVLGQPNLNSITKDHVVPRPFDFDLPAGIKVAADRLFICDTQLGRVLAWNQLPNTINIGADFALFAPYTPSGTNLTTTLSPFTTAFGIDVNGPPGEESLLAANPFENTVDIWHVAPMDVVAPDQQLGGDGADQSPQSPIAVSYDVVNHIVAVADFRSNRVLLWHGFDPQVVSANAIHADTVLGQADFTTMQTPNADPTKRLAAPIAVLLVPGADASAPCQLLVTSSGELDGSDHRVLIWNDVRSVTNNASADVAIGSNSTASVGTSSPVNEFNLDTPGGLAWDGSHLFVGDRGNHRVLIYFGIPNASGKAADALFGQPTFEDSGPNQGGINDRNLWTNNPGPALEAPGLSTGVIAGEKYLFVADDNNNRVLRVPIDVLDAP
jgi:hypothetical protein